MSLLSLLLVVMYFNSIKVRLKHPGNISRLMDMLLFQFHKGTIKTAVSEEELAPNVISIP